MKVVIYGSRVPGSKKVIGDQSQIFLILDGRQIEYTFIDISLDEFSNDKKYMLDKSGKSDIPQIFVNGEYKGVIDDRSNTRLLKNC